MLEFRSKQIDFWQLLYLYCDLVISGVVLEEGDVLLGETQGRFSVPHHRVWQLSGVEKLALFLMVSFQAVDHM